MGAPPSSHTDPTVFGVPAELQLELASNEKLSRDNRSVRSDQLSPHPPPPAPAPQVGFPKTAQPEKALLYQRKRPASAQLGLASSILIRPASKCLESRQEGARQFLHCAAGAKSLWLQRIPLLQLPQVAHPQVKLLPALIAAEKCLV